MFGNKQQNITSRVHSEFSTTSDQEWRLQLQKHKNNHSCYPIVLKLKWITPPPNNNNKKKEEEEGNTNKSSWQLQSCGNKQIHFD